MGIIDRARELRATVEDLATNLSDESALSNMELFPTWDGGNHQYVVGDRMRYNGELYKVLQAHISQPNWPPTQAPQLFALVLTDPSGTPQEWVQPDSTNAYMTGDKVIFNGTVYESLIDNNVWSPADYPAGWRVVE